MDAPEPIEPPRFPIWPGVLLMVAAVLCYTCACTIFHVQQDKAKEEVAAARNVHLHALKTFRQRCPSTPGHVPVDLTCDSFHAALKAQEKAIDAALDAIGAGRADLQMRDLRRATARVEVYDQ